MRAIWSSIIAGSFIFGLSVPVESKESAKWVYCAFLADGNTHISYCSKKSLEAAQAECDKQLEKKKIEGTCECTDDPDFIGDRCK